MEKYVRAPIRLFDGSAGLKFKQTRHTDCTDNMDFFGWKLIHPIARGNNVPCSNVVIM
jgi:hypothetical protein